MHILAKKDKIPLCKNCLLPKFVIEIVTVYRQQYVTMKPEAKEKLLDQIVNLQWSPALDYPKHE